MTSPNNPGSNDPGSNDPGASHPSANDPGASRPTAGAAGQHRALVVGTGLIGGSVGMALRRQGWHVSGWDNEPARASRAVELGAVDEVGMDYTAAVTFIAVPAGSVAAVARAVLSEQDAVGTHAVGPQVVTDVASTKEGIMAAVSHPRFVGGHPMAGSEQEGVDGADPDLFMGATWALTPDRHTSGEAFTEVQSLARAMGANPVALEPRRHDQMVALVSHVPHLTAAALMNLAADAATSDAVLLRLAAGGFRDMTRIAAGHPGIWPDIVAANREAILSSLDQLGAMLGKLRQVVADNDRETLLHLLQRAREGRVNLPTGAPSLERASELRVPVPDRPGVIAEVSTLLGSLGVNIFDLEIAHSAEGDRGVMVLVIDSEAEEVARSALLGRNFRVSSRRLGP